MFPGVRLTSAKNWQEPPWKNSTHVNAKKQTAGTVGLSELHSLESENQIHDRTYVIPSGGKDWQHWEIIKSELATTQHTCAVGATITSLMKKRAGNYLPTIVSILGFASLMIFKTRLDNQIIREGGGALTVTYLVGFMLSCAFFVVGALLCSVLNYLHRLERGQK